MIDNQDSFSICNHLTDYSSEITPVGQVPAHATHEIHAEASISYLPTPSAIETTGHEPAHAPHITHPSLI